MLGLYARCLPYFSRDLAHVTERLLSTDYEGLSNSRETLIGIFIIWVEILAQGLLKCGPGVLSIRSDVRWIKVTVSILFRVCVCLCVCVRARAREKERERESLIQPFLQSASTSYSVSFLLKQQWQIFHYMYAYVVISFQWHIQVMYAGGVDKSFLSSCNCAYTLQPVTTVPAH